MPAGNVCNLSFLTVMRRGSHTSGASKAGNRSLQSVLRLVGAADERFEVALTKRLPRVASAYRQFKCGTRSLFVDGGKYLAVRRDIRNGSALCTLRRHDLQVYRDFPRDILKVTPTLAIAALPFMTIVAAPIGLLFPKQMLSKHYWTEEQKVVFADQIHQSRKQHTNQIAETFKRLHSTTSEVGDQLGNACFSLVQKVQQGHAISPQDILCTRKLFAGDQPLALQQLSTKHKWHLSRSLGLRVMSLQRDAELLHLIDAAIVQEGSGSLTLPELQMLCFHRGLSPANRTFGELEIYLNAWCSISSSLKESELSLLLHSPIFLGSNFNNIRKNY